MTLSTIQPIGSSPYATPSSAARPAIGAGMPMTRDRHEQRRSQTGERGHVRWNSAQRQESKKDHEWQRGHDGRQRSV